MADGRSPELVSVPVVYSKLVGRRFRKIVCATAWLFLAWTAVDLTVPSLCALDQDRDLSAVSSSAARIDTASTNGTSPDSPVHVDDCFCCSGCVNVTALHNPETLSLVRTGAPFPSDGVTLPASFPPYHPPRV